MITDITQPNNIIIEKNQDPKPIRNKILVVTPTLGTIRIEWAQARYGQTTPCNWSAGAMTLGLTHFYPQGYLVADAQNIGVDETIKGDYEWMLLVEDDVVLPWDAFLKFNVYMREGKIPVVSGLYFLKANPSEPLIYRGRGNSCYESFKLGDKLWVDGVPTGCLLIHSSVLKIMYDESPEYDTGLCRKARKVFETPAGVFVDPETGAASSKAGTSDLYWCDRVMREKVLQRAGFKEIGQKGYPFLVDTSIMCKHIDMHSGVQYPLDENLKKWKR